jgi:hypothetical protein
MHSEQDPKAVDSGAWDTEALVSKHNGRVSALRVHVHRAELLDEVNVGSLLVLLPVRLWSYSSKINIRVISDSEQLDFSAQ